MHQSNCYRSCGLDSGQCLRIVCYFVVTRCIISFKGIRHPEELSLARKLEPEELKRNKGISATRRTRPVGIRNSTSSSGGGSGSHHLSNSSLLETGSSFGTSPRRFTPGRRTPGVSRRASVVRLSKCLFIIVNRQP